MTQERDSGKSEEAADRQTIAGQQSHESEYGEQGRESDGMSGQPIGGNDSNTGSGTTLTQGADSNEDATEGVQGDGFILRSGNEAEHGGPAEDDRKD